MPYDLKNAGATFQHMVNLVFKDLIGYTMKVYVDDMLVKSLNQNDYIHHLVEAFTLLWKYTVELNLEKCAFVVG